jgi:hypothetical protein
VVWRYDPLFLNDRYSLSFHVDAFGRTARELRGFTEKVIISFFDNYQRIARRTAELAIREPSDTEKRETAAQLAAIARESGMVIESCAESIDLSSLGIRHGACINGALFEPEGLFEGGIDSHHAAPLKKDRSQRPFCGCRTSIDIGKYGTCRHGCVYCYAGGRAGAQS